MTRLSYQPTEAERVKADSVIKQFTALNADQVDAYIDNNVTDLASAKTALKVFGKILLVLAKRLL